MIAGQSGGVLVRQTIIPLASVFALLMGMLWLWVRRTARAPGVRDADAVAAGLGRLLRHLLVTSVGGYAMFLAVVLLYYLFLGGQSRSFVTEALWGGAFLAFGVAVPAFLAAGALGVRRGR